MWLVTKTSTQYKSLHSIIIKLDNKLQRMLLWSNACTLLASIQIVFSIAKIYASFSGKSTGLLATCLVLITLVFGAFLYFKWKNLDYHHNHINAGNKQHISFQVNKLNKQLRFISVYLIIYSLMLWVSSLFFYLDVRNGLTLLFKLTFPVSLVIYVSGFYFMFGFTRQISEPKLLNKQLCRIGILKQVNQN